MERPGTRRSATDSDDHGANATSLTLLAGIRLDDEASWRRAVTLYTPFLRYWCRRWGVRGEEANDVVQEVFQAAFLGLKDFRRDRQGDSFRGWLRGIARHKVLTLLRRREGRGPGGTDFYRRSLLVPDSEGPPILRGDEADDRLDIEAVYRDLLGLVRAEFEDRTWQAFWRSVVDGQAPTVIAEELGVTPAAIRQSKSRILRRFKELLGESASAPGSSRPA